MEAKIYLGLFVLLGLMIGGLSYPYLDDKVASHWDAEGNVNGYMSKTANLIVFLGVLIFVYAMYWTIPVLDPKRANIKKFRRQFDMFIGFVMGFMLYIFGLSTAWNLGYRFDMTLMMVPAISVLMYAAGVLIEHSEQSWFIGIRTPWTLSRRTVWDKTKKLGGKLFKVAGVIGLLGLSAGRNAIWFILIPVILATLVSSAFSFFAFKQEQKK